MTELLVREGSILPKVDNLTFLPQKVISISKSLPVTSLNQYKSRYLQKKRSGRHEILKRNPPKYAASQSKHHHTASSAHFKNEICTGNLNLRSFSQTLVESVETVLLYTSCLLHPPYPFNHITNFSGYK